MKTLAEILRHPRVTRIHDGEDGGAFLVKRPVGRPLKVIASWGMGWDHVSVQHHEKTPTYQDMKMVKRIFFRSDEWAIEYHPPEEEYISVKDTVLHIWRPQDQTIPVPPSIMV